ncbi:MAG TPA: hypothetical protein VE669_09440 [Actinomycetota bacterium]|nr:hypothetical protein [Actinomycetota bacterium]
MCRVHLLDTLLREGDPVPFLDPKFDADLSGLFASAMWFVRLAMDGLPAEILSSEGPRWAMDMYAFIHPDDDWRLAQVGLDILGTHLADTAPFGAMRLEAPMDFQGRVLLRLQVGVPTVGIEELRPRLELATEGHLRELIGAEARLVVVVEPVDGTDDGR